MKLNSRTQKAKFNIITTLASQIVTVVCGIIVPRIMIGTFGSEAYGATTSIAQFLSYISLLEGGIGGVARAELYKPLADRDAEKISSVYNAVKRMFRIVGGIFLIYTLIIAIFYHDIAKVEAFDREFTFFLVIVISISTIAQYFSGIADQTLLNADQKRYITNLIVIVTTILNTVLIVVLTWMGCNILVVKLFSSCAFVIRPVLHALYVKRNYSIISNKKRDPAVLSQRWTGLGQHLAYFLHTNTDVVVLTLLADLRYVSVYSVYNLIITSMRNLITSFSGGMEAVFGEMIAKGEQKSLTRTYNKYMLLLSVAATVLLGVTAVMIVPFVRLYTQGITDANYIQPMFSVIFIFAEAINCLAIPCSTLPVSANKFKETRWGAYGEAAINITVSCALIFWNPLLGVAIGTLAAAVFKSIFYMVYAAKHILRVSPARIFGKFCGSLLVIGVIFALGVVLTSQVQITNFWIWIIAAVAVFVLAAVISGIVHGLLYPDEVKPLFREFRRKAGNLFK